MVRFINGRLSLRARLSILTLLFIAPLVIMTLLFVNTSSKDIAFARKEAEGSAYLQAAWPALVAAASHALNGETTELARLVAQFTIDDGDDARAAA